MIRIPRAVFDRYWPLSWAELHAAATREIDGLSIGEPATGGPGALQYYMENGLPEALPTTHPQHALRENLRQNIRRDLDVAYMREGTDFLSRGKALLYQQGW